MSEILADFNIKSLNKEKFIEVDIIIGEYFLDLLFEECIKNIKEEISNAIEAKSYHFGMPCGGCIGDV